MLLNSAAHGVRTMHIYLRGDSLQRLRLASGLILFAFAATHFLNHALGLVGLEAMHTAQEWRTAVTRSWPGTIVLVSALIVHILLGLYKLAKRETWRMPRWEAAQIAFGVAIPFLLFPHIVNTRIAHTFFGVEILTCTSSSDCGQKTHLCKACYCCWFGRTAASASTTGSD